jgi:Uma2 family endonuclease
MTLAPPRYVTWDEYLESADFHERTEWVDGEVRFMTSVHISHDSVGKFLIRIFEEYLEANPAGEVFGEQVLMRNPIRPSGRCPDLKYVSKERLHLVTRTYIDVTPDVAIEIISPDSRYRDTVDKFKEYETFGIPEYWILDADEMEAHFYLLQDGKYREILADNEGIYRSKMLPGFWFKVEWLWPGYQPTMRQVRQEWGID